MLSLLIGTGACTQEPINNTCSSNQSCVAGFLCIAGTCQREALFSTCENDLDCALDQYCDIDLQVCINLDSGTRRSMDAGFTGFDAEDGSGVQSPNDAAMDASFFSDSGVGFSDAGAEARIFVSKTGDDGADGLNPQTSLLSITAGLRKSRECRPSPCEVLVSVGNYLEQVILYDGVYLWGGFSEDFARQDPATWPVVITSTQARTVVGDGLSQQSTLAGIQIQGADFSSEDDGRSVYALWLRDSSNVVLSETMVNGGLGARGAQGEDGILSVCNSPGGQGGEAYNCGSRSGANGEAGGDPVAGGAGGSGGSSNCPNACPLVGGQGVSRGDHGSDGSNGTNGLSGIAPTDNLGTWVDGAWRGVLGQPGTRGAHGTGGGGGGSGGTKKFVACFGCNSLLGGRGADGASGGCGGGAGSPGLSGGGSFAIVLVNSRLELERSSVSGGIGGQGGAGGAGHPGETGGTEITNGRGDEARQRCGLIDYRSAKGGRGGLGGAGGRGGGGPGGNGGVSIGVVLVTGASMSKDGSSTLNAGVGGAGGTGGMGSDLAPSGLNGFTAAEKEF